MIRVKFNYFQASTDFGTAGNPCLAARYNRRTERRSGAGHLEFRQLRQRHTCLRPQRWNRTARYNPVILLLCQANLIRALITQPEIIVHGRVIRRAASCFCELLQRDIIVASLISPHPFVEARRSCARGDGQRDGRYSKQQNQKTIQE